MSQDVSVLSLLPQNGTAYTVALNNALLAVASWYRGSVDPVNIPGQIVVAGFAWIDTNTVPATIKLRNAGNTAWNDIGKEDGTPSAAVQALLDAKLPLAGGTMTGAIVLAADPTAALHPASKQWVEGLARPAPVRFSQAGNATVANGIAEVVIEQACQLTELHVAVKTAPTGASLIAQVSLLRSTLDTDPPTSTATRTVTLAATKYRASVTLGTPLAMQAGDHLQFDITQVGSTVAGGNPVSLTGKLSPP
jgi:hypothetical protein